MWKCIVVVLLSCARGAPAGTHDVSIVVEPDGRHGQQLIDAIAGAQRSIAVEVYQLGDRRVLAALVERASAIPVTVVLDGSDANRAWNRPAYSHLEAAGARVAWSSPAFQYTHAKVVVIDNVAWIMTMNLDYSSPTDNREYLAIDRDAADVAEVRAIIAADFDGRPIDPDGDLVVANANARARLDTLIESARATLDVEVEELADAAIAGAIADAARGGVRVRVVIARQDLAPWQLDAAQAIVAAGGAVVESGPDASHRDDEHPYVHAKAIVVDGIQAYVGSTNLSATSLGKNREIGVIVDALPRGPAMPDTVDTDVDKIEAAIARDFAAGTRL